VWPSRLTGCVANINELFGELSVKCDLPGARTSGGSLLTADFNLSGYRSRKERATALQARANTGNQVDWDGLIEEFCQCVLQAERTGQPAVDLRTLPVPAADDVIEVEGLPLLRRHPTILFGDGGAAKSYPCSVSSGAPCRARAECRVIRLGTCG
jgi:hypothetical protein